MDVNPFQPSFKVYWQDFEQPRRWTRAFGWLCFVPLTRRQLNAPMFASLVRLPQVQRAANRWSLPEEVTRVWRLIDDFVFNAATLLQVKFQAPAVFPFRPLGWRYHNSHKSPELAEHVARASRDWFLVWMGALSFLISHARWPTDAVSPKPRPSNGIDFLPEEWETHLRKDPDLEALVEQLASSPVVDFSAPRAGLVVDFMEKADRSEPSIIWLMGHNIPVWYCINPAVLQFASDRGLTYLMPPVHVLQQHNTTLVSTPSAFAPSTSFSSSNIALDVPPSPSEPSSAVSNSVTYPTSAAEYEANSAIRHRLILGILEEYEREAAEKRRTWSATEAQAARSRARQPSVKNASMIVYEARDLNPLVLDRKEISKGDREVEWDLFNEKQRRFFPELNLWVCCDDLAPSKLVLDHNHDEFANDSPEPEADIQPPSQIGSSLQEPAPSVPIPQSLVQSTPASIILIALASPEYFAYMYNDAAGPETLRDDLSQALSIFSGFTPAHSTSTMPATTSYTGKQQSIFIRSWGIHPTTTAAPLLFGTALAHEMHQFHMDIQNDKPSSQRWDTVVGNPQFLSHPAMYNIVVIWSSHPNKMMDCNNFHRFWFLFNDSNVNGCKLAVTTATDALAVVRLLRLNRTYEGIALYLASHGVPFRTFRTVTSPWTTIPYHPIPVRLPLRLPGHHFTNLDYESYVHQRSLMLGNPRARAALLQGGLLWRLADGFVQYEDAVAGPTGCSKVISIVHPHTSEQLFDDHLSSLEEHLLVGAYTCIVHPSNPVVSIKSWWPLCETWENAEDLGRWSTFNELWYQDRLRAIRNGTAQPLTKSEWRATMKGRKEMKINRVNIERHSRSFIQAQAPASCSHLALDIADPIPKPMPMPKSKSKSKPT
jgi:hypothetical protein